MSDFSKQEHQIFPKLLGPNDFWLWQIKVDTRKIVIFLTEKNNVIPRLWFYLYDPWHFSSLISPVLKLFELFDLDGLKDNN
jgi:hypothetical protein